MRPGRRAATAFALLDLAVCLANLVLVAVPGRPGVLTAYPSPPLLAMLAAFLVLTPILGAIVAARHPRNPAGWLFLAMALLLGWGFLADSIARHLPASPQVGLFVSIASDVGSVWTVALTLLVALFPDGRLPSRRWWIVVALPIAGTAMQIGASLFDPSGGISPPIAGLTYPLARPDWGRAILALNDASQLLTAVGVAGTFGLLAVRLRRSRGVERQQLKWFVWAASTIASVLVVGMAVNQLNADWGTVAWSVFQGALVLLPLAVAAAIMRYRLFEIDRLINRTLVYAGLSGVLAATYGASVVVLGTALGPVTRSSSIAVAASTLLVAALFQPARGRLQRLVDRRFYRARYDADREVARFGLRLRGEMDVERVEGILGATVERTVQPAFASVWVRSRPSR